MSSHVNVVVFVLTDWSSAYQWSSGKMTSYWRTSYIKDTVWCWHGCRFRAGLRNIGMSNLNNRATNSHGKGMQRRPWFWENECRNIGRKLGWWWSYEMIMQVTIVFKERLDIAFHVGIFILWPEKRLRSISNWTTIGRDLSWNRRDHLLSKDHDFMMISSSWSTCIWYLFQFAWYIRTILTRHGQDVHLFFDVMNTRRNRQVRRNVVGTRTGDASRRSHAKTIGFTHYPWIVVANRVIGDWSVIISRLFPITLN